MSYSIQCGQCQAILNLANAVPAGQKVRCPRCKQIFTVAAEVSSGAEPLAAPVVTAPAPEAAQPQIDDVLIPALEEIPADATNQSADDERRRKKRRRARKRRRALREAGATGVMDDPLPNQPETKKTSPWLLILSIGGGIIGLCVCVGAAFVGYSYIDTGSQTPDIIGRWQNDQVLTIKATYDFQRNGAGKLRIGDAAVDFDYRLTGSLLTIIPSHKAGGAKGLVVHSEEVQYRVARIGNTLEFSNPEKRGVPPVVYRKVD